MARVVAGRPYLLIARYDRSFDEGGRAHRLHQEDFCQALGIPPERKYAAEDGPTFKPGAPRSMRSVRRLGLSLQQRSAWVRPSFGGG